MVPPGGPTPRWALAGIWPMDSGPLITPTTGVHSAGVLCRLQLLSASVERATLIMVVSPVSGFLTVTEYVMVTALGGEPLGAPAGERSPVQVRMPFQPVRSAGAVGDTVPEVADASLL